jgi:cardiolipin synthase
MVRVTGPVVWQLQVTFIGDWYFETGKLKGESAYFPGPFVTGEVAIQALPSGPGYAVSNNQRLFVNLLHRASERVVLTTPYFIPDEAFLQALETATARGVDVHLVVSAQADQFLVSHAQRSYYEQLLEWGVVVHLYHRAFLHAKHISVDKDIAIIGSSNMDIRSFLLDDEISLLIYDKEVNTRLRAQEEYYFAHAEQLCLEQWRQRPLKDRVLQSSTRLVGPLL